jgi:DNA-binding transcriptional regulator YiaG
MAKITSKDVGKIVKFARTFMILDMHEFGAKYDKTHQSVRRWENGSNDPGSTVLLQIIKDSGLPIERIWKLTDRKG